MQVDKVETVEKGLTIEQASELLGVSKDTIRRRIRKGELNAIKRVGPYGDQFFIDESELDIATEIKEVIPIVRNLSIQDFSRTLELALGNAIAPMQQQIDTWQRRTRLYWRNYRPSNRSKRGLSRINSPGMQRFMQNIRLIPGTAKEEVVGKVIGKISIGTIGSYHQVNVCAYRHKIHPKSNYQSIDIPS